MKKLSVALLTMTVFALVLMSAIRPAQAYIERFTWLPPYIEKGYSGYYGNNVVIYEDGSTVNLLVPVRNDWYPNGLNVSKVIVSFDWGGNKTLDASASVEQVGWQETEVFNVSFMASATEAVSSDWAHEYTIYVEHVNATAEPKEVVDTWSRSWNWWSPAYRFVVFSTDQVEANDLSHEYGSYADAFPTWSFNSIDASTLAGQAEIEASLGGTYYVRGDYDSATTQYETALDLYDHALTAEKAWRTKIDDAELNVTLTQAAAHMTEANAMLRQADATMKISEATVNQSFAWILFGLGFTFMGIATIVYAWRKPKTG
jgi:hypothetical protein